uniref:Ribonuclease H1 n=1 Tax=Globodera rostochiensis TaxID=31243 RepID=A0A914I5Q3_GLORO
MRCASFYAVARGRGVGVFSTWEKCLASVNGFPGARFKKFPTFEEASKFVEKNKGTASGGGILVAKDAFKPTKPKLGRQKANGIFKNGSCPAESAAVVGEAAATLASAVDDAVGDDTATIVYTDGACSRNGCVGAKAGFGVFWSDDHPDNVSAPVVGEPTNNRAEYLAVIAAVEKAKARNIRRLVIRTDSELLIQSMTKWLTKWRRNGWKTVKGKDVRNRDLLERLDKLMAGDVKTKFEKVAGHSGNYGNDQADLLARRGAEMYMGKRLIWS